MGFLHLLSNREPALCWTLLLREADRMGIQVNDQMIDSFLQAEPIGWSPEQVKAVVLNMSEARERRWTEKNLRTAVGNYLRISQAFTLGTGVVPVGQVVGEHAVFSSEPELRQMYNDLVRQITLAAVSFEARDYLPPDQTATQPASGAASAPATQESFSEEQIQKLFQECRQNEARRRTTPTRSASATASRTACRLSTCW